MQAGADNVGAFDHDECRTGVRGDTAVRFKDASVDSAGRMNGDLDRERAGAQWYVDCVGIGAKPVPDRPLALVVVDRIPKTAWCGHGAAGLPVDDVDPVWLATVDADAALHWG